MSLLRYQRDVYKCTKCEDWIAQGDAYCKHCGHGFTIEDTQLMLESSTFRKKWNAPFVYNYDVKYKCSTCHETIEYGDIYCKHCGICFNENDIKTMKRDNTSNTLSTYKVSIVFFISAMLFLFIVFSLLIT